MKYEGLIVFIIIIIVVAAVVLVLKSDADKNVECFSRCKEGGFATYARVVPGGSNMDICTCGSLENGRFVFVEVDW